MDIDTNEKIISCWLLGLLPENHWAVAKKKKLPLTSFPKNCSYISPEKRAEAGALESVSILTQKVTGLLSNVLINFFPKQKDLTCDQVCDIIRTKCRFYQTENIPE